MGNQQYADAIGQFPFLKGYNHLVLGFSVPDISERRPIVTALQAAVKTVTSRIPWLEGAVVNVESGPGNSGRFQTVPWPCSALPNDMVRVNFCEDSVPSFTDLVKNGAPMAMLNGDNLTPYPGLPLRYEESESKPAPVALLQVNFIDGGLLLTCSGQHNIIDGAGLFQFYTLVATVMQGEPLPDEVVDQANQDRSKVVPLLGTEEHIKDHEYLRRPPLWNAQAPVSPSKFEWAVFRLKKTAIPSIKKLASGGEGYDESVPFISSDDAVNALCWKLLATARLRNGQSPDTRSKFNRAIDVRRTMGVPAGYMGHMIYHAASFLTFGELERLSIAAIACRLRRDITAANTRFSVQSYVTFIAREPDKSSLVYGGPYNITTDFAASSAPQLDFNITCGPLGPPKFLRKPNSAPIPGCMHFLPPENGHPILLVCLSQADMQFFRRDSEWTEYAEFIG